MARKVGSIYAEVLAKLDKLEKSLNQGQQMAQRSAAKMQATFDKISFDKAADSFSKFKRLLIAGIAGVKIKNVAEGFIETAASFEMMKTKLEALEGARGLRLFEDLNKMALELPVSTQKVVQSFVTMQAMGLEPTRRQMLILADTAAVLGDDVFDRIVLQLGQMSAKGKIMAQDLNILAEAGINARGILAEAFGMTVEQLQSSNIEIEKVIEALFEGMNRKFGGSSEKIMNTWRGVTELMKSNWIEIERTIADAGVFDLLKEQIKGVSDGLKNWLENNREIIKQDVPKYVDRVRAALESVKSQFEALWKILTYDPAIIEFGLLGLLIGGKKGAILAGGAAHLLKIPGMLAEATALAAKGHASMADIAMADFKELEAIIEKGRKLQAGWTPEPLPLAASHGGNLAWTHGVKRNLTEAEQYADGWRKRWVDEWRTWGIKTPNIKLPPSAEDVEKELAKIEAAQKKALQKHKDMIEAYAAVAGSMFSADFYPVESGRAKSFTQSIENAQKAAEEFEQRNIELWKNPIILDEAGKTFDELISLTERTAEAMQQNFSDVFFDAMTGELKSLEDYANAVFRSIQRALADIAGQMATQALFGQEFKGGGLLSQAAGWIGSYLGTTTPTGMGTNTIFSGGGSMGDFIGMVKHSGGGFGSGGASRRIPASAFSFAPRLHNGLMPNEFPAVLEKGETVIPKNGGGMKNNFNINIMAPNGQIGRESLNQLQTSLYTVMQRAGRRNT